MVLQRALICPVVIGREAELEELRSALTLAVAGRGGLVLVSGEPGIGKSRLLSEACAIAEGLSFSVLRGSAYANDGAVPYAPLVDALHSTALLDELRDLVVGAIGLSSATAATPAGVAERRVTFERIYSRLAEAAGARPLLLVLDDLHWADATTLAFLDLVASRLAGLPLVVLTAARDSEATTGSAFRAWIQELDRRRRVQLVPLEPLDNSGVERMVDATLRSGLQADRLRRLQELAEGNPFFVEELLRALPGSSPGREALALPVNLRDTILSRLSELAGRAREVAESAAVIGRRFDLRLLESVGGVTPGELSELVHELQEWGVLDREVEGTTYRFRHVLIHQAYEESLALARRRELHGTVARALAGQLGAGGTVATAGDLGRHWLEAEEHELALDAFVAAGHAAAAIYAFDEAREQYDRALSLLPPSPTPNRYDLLMNHARAAAISGRVAVAISDYEAAATLASELEAPDLEGEALRLLGRQHSFSGRGEEAIPRLRRAVDLLEPFPPKSGWARAYLGQALMMEEQEDEASQWAERALQSSEESGDRALRASALNTLGVCKRRTEGYVAGLDLVAQAIEEAEASGVAEEIGRAHNNYVHMLAYAARPLSEVVRALDRGLASMARVGELSYSLFTAASMAKVMIHAGQWERASALLESADVSSSDVQQRTAAHISVARGLFAYYRADWCEARAHLSSALSRLTDSQGLDPIAMTVAYLSRAQRLLAQPDRSEEFAERLLAGAVATGSLTHVPALIRERVMQLLDLGDVDGAKFLTSRFRDVPEQSAVFQRKFAILLCDGALAFAGNDFTRGTQLYTEAVLLADQHGMTVLAGDALTEAGAALVRRRSNADRARGEDMLDRARAIFSARGSDFVDRYLAASGVAPAGPRNVPPELRVLSARELEVFGCLGQGRSNRQIAEQLVLSERTVERHLFNIYAKLGLPGRSAAIALAARLDAGTHPMSS